MNLITTTTGAPPALALGLGRSRRLMMVADYAEASRVYRAACEAHERTGKRCSTFPEGRVYDASGVTPGVVARVSWNGRVWRDKTWAPGDEPLYSPAPTTVEGSAR